MSKSIFVMGGTGTVGRSLLTALRKQGENVRAASRTPEKADLLANENIRWVEFDLERPETFDAALKGCNRMFMISRPGDEQAERFAEPLIEAVQHSGIRHIVNLSAMGTEERPDFSLHKVEQIVETSGIPYTHLRPNFFMQVYATGAIGLAVRNTGKIMLPAADAKLSLVDAGDVAAVAAEILRHPEAYANQAYTLTGGSAVSHQEIAALIAETTERDVQYVPIDDQAMAGLLKSIGWPGDRISRLIEMYRLVRLGKCEPVFPDVERILSRPPLGFRDFARLHADLWRQTGHGD